MKEVKESNRTKFLKKIYADEIDSLYYEEYISNDNLKRLKTYMVLNDSFHTTFNLDNYGLFDEDKIKYLESNNYKSSNVKKLTKNM